MCRDVVSRRAASFPLSPGIPLVKPNYSYEKRQKELAKERKKQEKLQRKANKSESGAPDASPQPDQPSGDERGEGAADQHTTP